MSRDKEVVRGKITAQRSFSVYCHNILRTDLVSSNKKVVRGENGFKPRWIWTEFLLSSHIIWKLSWSWNDLKQSIKPARIIRQYSVKLWSTWEKTSKYLYLSHIFKWLISAKKDFALTPSLSREIWKKYRKSLIKRWNAAIQTLLDRNDTYFAFLGQHRCFCFVSSVRSSNVYHGQV